MTGRRRVGHRPDPTRRIRAPRQPPLPAGQLRAMILAHLAAYPQSDFSAAELAKVLGRPNSRGAVATVCIQLVGDGLAVCTARRRYRHTT